MLTISPAQMNRLGDEDRRRFIDRVEHVTQGIARRISPGGGLAPSVEKIEEIIDYFSQLDFLEERQLLLLVCLATVYRESIESSGSGMFISQIVRNRAHEADERTHAMLLALSSEFRAVLEHDGVLWQVS